MCRTPAHTSSRRASPERRRRSKSASKPAVEESKTKARMGSTVPARRYDDAVMSPKDATHPANSSDADFVRDPLASPAAMLSARERSMSERLELALSWNTVAAELRAGLKASISQTHQGR